MKKIILLVLSLFSIILFNLNDAHAITVGLNDYNITDYYTLANDTNITTQTFTGGDNFIGGKLYYLDSLTDVHLVQFELNADINYLSAFRYLYFAHDSSNDPFDSDFNVLYVNISGDNYSSNYDTISDVRYWGSEYTVSGFTPTTVLHDNESYLGSLFTVGSYTSKIYVSFIVQSTDTASFVLDYLLDYLARQIYITNRTALNILNSSFLDTTDLQDAYDEGYDDASDNYINNIIPAEKTESYNQARDFYAIYYNEQWYNASSFGDIQYDLAKEEYGIFYNGQWYNAIDWGNIKYQDGINDGNDNGLAVMFNGLASIFGVGLAFVLQLGSIELMGISLNMILGIGLLLVGLIAILGLIFGGK